MIITILKVLMIDQSILADDLLLSLLFGVLLFSRFASFHQSLLSCEKFQVRYLARLQQADQRTVFGRTLFKIGQECDTNVPSKAVVKRKIKCFAVQEAETWRPPLLSDLVKVREDISTLPGFSLAEVEEMYQFCRSEEWLDGCSSFSHTSANTLTPSSH